MTGKPYKTRWKGSALALAIAVGITGVVTAALHARVSAEQSASLRAPMPVEQTAFIEQQDFQREQKFLGLVQAASRSQVGFEVPGAIAEVFVREGQAVEAGAALAKLDTQTLEARRRAAASAVDQASAELELASARRVRQAPLAESGAISAQLFDDTRLAEKAVESALAAAQARLDSLEIDLEKSVLRAPYAARIGRQLLDRGAVTQPGAPVFTLTSLENREAHIGVAVEQARYLTVGKNYPLQWRDRSLSAPLVAVRSDVNPVSMTTVAIFSLPGDVDAFDGEPVSVSVPRTEPETGGWLPLSALIEGERGIWTVLALRERDGNTVALREVVEVLHVSGDRAFVRGSVRDGDRLIADGVHRIAPGTAVAPLEAPGLENAVAHQES
ncbi:efflux RND transporter periplasmic adaptor subunit [Congregibacter litoralis]|uniref:RND family efflux transporter, MFP subunit n=1 Tax=Congregibacter litoralis KT71 TaxID=314285 RepID=A4A868_9GAMM|nr:efflux RND transporter periplasmic adaptor subunit [Congregibacter litoralis]EAQ97863.1 RND family efflux transporter, MFP subunit [Congregibacter litoralis KT71]